MKTFEQLKASGDLCRYCGVSECFEEIENGSTMCDAAYKEYLDRNERKK